MSRTLENPIPVPAEGFVGDWWTPAMMPDPSLDTKELSSISGISVSPSHHPLHSSMALPKTSYSVISAFCSEENIPQCITYINQEVCSLGLTGVSLETKAGVVSAVPVLNLLYEVLQLQKRAQRALHDLETQQLKSSSDLEHLQHSSCRLKDQLEHTRRENSGLHEGERQLQLRIKTLQNCLKSEKEEVRETDADDRCSIFASGLLFQLLLYTKLLLSNTKSEM